eukprot:8878883-Alexandrium_andersonii.AAC.1
MYTGPSNSAAQSSKHGQLQRTQHHREQQQSTATHTTRAALQQAGQNNKQRQSIKQRSTHRQRQNTKQRSKHHRHTDKLCYPSPGCLPLTLVHHEGLEFLNQLIC